MKYIINNLAVLSILLNTLTGGSYRNTFSARSGRACYEYKKTWGKISVKIIDTIFFFDENHCYKEYVDEFKLQ